MSRRVTESWGAALSAHRELIGLRQELHAFIEARRTLIQAREAYLEELEAQGRLVQGHPDPDLAEAAESVTKPIPLASAFRLGARLVHPDQAVDEDDRLRRESFVKLVYLAYLDEDLGLVDKLTLNWLTHVVGHGAPSAVDGDRNDKRVSAYAAAVQEELRILRACPEFHEMSVLSTEYSSWLTGLASQALTLEARISCARLNLARAEIQVFHSSGQTVAEPRIDTLLEGIRGELLRPSTEAQKVAPLTDGGTDQPAAADTSGQLEVAAENDDDDGDHPEVDPFEVLCPYCLSLLEATPGDVACETCGTEFEVSRHGRVGTFDLPQRRAPYCPNCQSHRLDYSHGIKCRSCGFGV